MRKTSCTGWSTHGGRAAGFTLLELITVLAIMVIIMGAAVGSIVGARRGAEMRSGVAYVRTAVALARQHAVTKREKTWINFQLGGRDFWVANDSGAVGETNHLSPGLRFATAAFGYAGAPQVIFYPTGASGYASNSFVIIGEITGTQTNILKLYGLTGLMRTEVSM